MKERITIYNTPEACTCCYDVEKLLEFKGGNEVRDYTLYRTTRIRADRSVYDEIYFLLIEDDKFPIIITENVAESILKNPDEGEKLAYNRWFDRYR